MFSISEDVALALLTSAYADAKGSARIVGHKSGSINQVFQFEFGGHHLALRVRHNEKAFQYEKGLFKEVLIGLLASCSEKRGNVYLDDTLINIWDDITGRRSDKRIHFSLGADIFYYDFTGAIFPAPWGIFEWAGDSVGAEFNAENAFQLGQAVARIHRMKFENAYSNLYRLRFGGVDILSAWQAEILHRNRVTARVIISEQVLARKLRPLQDAGKDRPSASVFCHNDLHCLNLTQKDGSLRILDWDNAQIAPKELDFVKIAHWSRLNRDGYFEPDQSIFSCFCGGYGASADEVRSSPIFKLAELLWLFRVFEFASSMTEPAKPPFWPASRYADFILEKLART